MRCLTLSNSFTLAITRLLYKTVIKLDIDLKRNHHHTFRFPQQSRKCVRRRGSPALRGETLPPPFTGPSMVAFWRTQLLRGLSQRSKNPLSIGQQYRRYSHFEFQFVKVLAEVSVKAARIFTAELGPPSMSRVQLVWTHFQGGEYE